MAAADEAERVDRDVKTTNEWHFYSGTPDAPLCNVALFSGSANKPLAAEVAKYLGMRLSKVSAGKFADGETAISVHESVRGKNVYILQPTSAPVDDNLAELLLMVSTMRRASASRIVVIIPYFGYSRQDRKLARRLVPISAAEVAKMLTAAGVDEVVSVDLHRGQIQGFFGPRVPCTNLTALPVGAAYFSERPLQSPVVVAPSTGSLYNARTFRDAMARFGSPAGLAIVLKTRELQDGGGPSYALKSTSGDISRSLVGDVRGSDVIMVDDMMDTARTACAAAKLVKERGAARVFAFAPHGLFSGEAATLVDSTKELDEVVVTDTVAPGPLELQQRGKGQSKITRLSVAPLLAEAIKLIQLDENVADVYRTVL